MKDQNAAAKTNRDTSGPPLARVLARHGQA